ncbi:MAG: biotin--[acetyl-CoA-carboxylase] ligase [Gracilimonas sp.]|uniref:biotin--[acetyl-CoA-carboxylase] ligase n=1 Tax=Gracilimonas TaxID=649462 RepID=UPI001B25515B|nr:biotin--[acetyl-CoA-carboxylase] ligase [Gracilimonas sp.]MBO6585220.1 biotin--[acetyl-CoA-carboxylase] ligase [Gracilimonas sp.]MBO6615508.1 biotin--[acetyl-CoA-carboxylase] ligase [Gracilimonas sp.]
MFDSELFENHLATSWLGRSFYFFEELPSTNSYSKQLNGENSQHGALVLTDDQTGGRGQYDRIWKAEPGKNLTFSLVFEPQKAERFTLLTLACALAVSEIVNACAEVDTKLKWPNDILCNGKKLCGILTETQFSGNKLERVVVGLGLNINQVEFQGGLAEKATSLRKECGKEFSREKVLADILQKIEYRYRLWNQFDADLVKQINRALIGFGEWTRLEVNDEQLDGEFKFLGVDESGSLIALNKDYDIRSFSHEQVRVQA